MISIDEYRDRRARLFEQLPTGSVALIAAAKEVTRSRDTEFPFRQNSDFFYLTGFSEPDAWLLLTASASYIFVRPKDALAEIWQGRRLGAEAAADALGMDIAYPLDRLDEKLPQLLDGQSHLYFCLGQDKQDDHRLMAMLETLRNAPKQSMSAPPAIVDPRPLIHEMRLFKSAAELDVMRAAAQISAQAHTRAMKFCSVGRFEYQLEAEIQHEFAMQGARHSAYATIVGSGENGCILHYTENTSPLKDGELVLIDAGCELYGYAADITRTFPVNGRFSTEQRSLYELVLLAQQKALEHIKPGTTLTQATEVAAEVITTGLIQLGILSGTVEDNLAEKTYRRYFMHGLGHWLGLDVHDVGAYRLDGQDRPFEPGMVLTVEPGVYIAPDDEQVESQWRGIGIRIEDNVLVTHTGYENLTDAVVKQADDIEALMAE